MNARVAKWLLPAAIPLAQRWVRAERRRHRASQDARPLRETERAVLRPFFAEEILEKARVVPVERLANPWFFPLLRRIGIEPPLDMAQAGGITLDDTIVTMGRAPGTEAAWHSLLFHEMVHVVQYSLLGLDRFIEEYARGFVAEGMDYYAIPFERQAYRLEARFASAPQVPFPAGEEVWREFGKARE